MPIKTTIKELRKLIRESLENNNSINESYQKKFRTGDRVQISFGSGLDSNKIGTVVNRNTVRTDNNMVPKNISGAYKPVNWNFEVAVQLDDGELITMFKNRLTHISNDTSKSIQESYFDDRKTMRTFHDLSPEANGINLTRINSDINGNPRYVVHFLNVLSKEEKNNESGGLDRIENLYTLALLKARAIGGRRFHNKQYGGGIVFQSYNESELKNDIHNLSLQSYEPKISKRNKVSPTIPLPN